MVEFTVVLVEPKYEGNVGSIARVMRNFGFEKLVLVKPPKLGGEARAKSMHGRKILDDAEKVESIDELKGRFDFLVGTTAKVASDKNVRRTPVTPDQLENATEAKGKVALLFGREDYGLLNEEIDACDMLVSIPANYEYPTLNLAQSVGIVLYELSKLEYTRKIMRRKYRKLEAAEKDVLLENYDYLVDLVYLEEYKRKLAKKTFKTLLGRSFVSGAEATTLIGVFRRLKDRIEAGKKK